MARDIEKILLIAQRIILGITIFLVVLAIVLNYFVEGF